MAQKIEVTVTQAKADLKKLGYSVRVKTYSEFKAATVLRDGVKINGGNAIPPEHYEAHKAFYEYKATHSIHDGVWRVVL